MFQTHARFESAFYRRANRTEFHSYSASWLKQSNRNDGYLSEMQLFYTNQQSYFELISRLMLLEEMEECALFTNIIWLLLIHLNSPQ